MMDKTVPVLCTAQEAAELAASLDDELRARCVLCQPGDAVAASAQVAFVSRDVTGLSTKFETMPDTARFYEAMRASPDLRWMHVHSAGADRAFYLDMHQQGVALTTSQGASDSVVAQTALAGVLALARRLPALMAAQRRHEWEPLLGARMPPDLEGQHAVIVGWGGIGRRIGELLRVLGLSVSVARHGGEPAGEGYATLRYGELPDVLPRTDWLILACPLTADTRGLIDARALAALPAHACLVNVARGHVVDEPALIEALRERRLGGAFLDVFHHEPLPAASPLWDLDNVIATPHSAGFSRGNRGRVRALFVENLRRWVRGEPLRNRYG